MAGGVGDPVLWAWQASSVHVLGPCLSWRGDVEFENHGGKAGRPARCEGVGVQGAGGRGQAWMRTCPL